MKDRSFLYGLRAYFIYVKVEERSFLYELRAYLIYVKVVCCCFILLRPW